MKKHIIGLSLIAIGSSLIAATDSIGHAYSLIDDYIAMEKGHKDDWLSFAQDRMDAKFNIMKKHSDQDFKLWADRMKEKGKRGEQGIHSPKLLHEGLNAMLQLSDQQLDDWKETCQKYEERAHKLYSKHKAEIQKLKDEAMPAKVKAELSAAKSGQPAEAQAPASQPRRVETSN